MTDDAFLADIRENPDDDAPRLVYSDWLDDQDQHDRAEFIRLQCHAARGKVGAAAKEREEELLESNGGTWAGLVATHASEYRFRRGFVEWVDLGLPSLVAHGAALFARHPIRFVECHNARTDDVRAFARLGQLGRLAGFSMSATIRDAGLRLLLDSPNLRGLSGLAIHDTPIGPKGLRLLLASPVCDGLTHLSVANAGIGPTGLKELTRCARLSSLVALDLRGSGVTADGVRQVADSPHLANVRRLGLWYNRLGDVGVDRLIGLPLFARLRHLELGYNGLTARGIRALADTPALANLRTLWLGVDRYTDDAMLALAKSPFLHPEARVMFWFFSSTLEEETRSAIREVLGDRVDFDGADAHREDDGLVRWPPWRPD